jgi:hypothetical protein
MIFSTIERAILDRIKADTGTGGLYVSGAWNTTFLSGGAWANTGRPNVARASLYPYLVYSMNATGAHGFIDDAWEVSITFTVYDEPINGVSRITSVLDRLFGNAIITSGRTPTYGFHRHVLVLSTNDYSAVGGDVTCKTMSVEALDENVVQGTITFDTTFSALAANP